MAIDLQDYNVVITGGAKRIGREIVVALANRGASILIHYNSSQREVDDLVQSLSLINSNLNTIKADFRDSVGASLVVKAAKKLFNKVDLLINNASLFPSSHLLKAKSYKVNNKVEDEFRETLAVNLETPFLLIHKLYPLLKRSKRGQVINMLDASVINGFSSRPTYAASKAALSSLTTSLGKALAPDVLVCGLALGKILAGEGMSYNEAHKVKWLGSKKVVEEILSIIDSPLESGAIKTIS